MVGKTNRLRFGLHTVFIRSVGISSLPKSYLTQSLPIHTAYFTHEVQRTELLNDLPVGVPLVDRNAVAYTMPQRPPDGCLN